MKTKNLVVVGMLLFAAACGTSDREFSGEVNISGELKNQPGGIVLLSQYMDDRTEVLDTIQVDNSGKFDYNLSLDGPGFYELNLNEEKFVRLALHHEDVSVNYDFQDEESLSIEGSEDTEQMLKVDELSEAYQEQINQLNSEYY